MATDLKTRTSTVKMTRFFGGQDRGTCVQVSADKFREQVSLTRAEAFAVAQDLLEFAAGEEKTEFE